MSEFVCETCGNSNPRYLGVINGKIYCRRCINFKGELAEDISYPTRDFALELNYALTEDQIRVSDEVLANYINGKNSLVHAVCGAGKTEIVYQVITYAVKNCKKVGFAIPRRDVVIELEARLRSAFPRLSVVSLYGGHTEELSGDIIILTTHQLYRYPKYFDLLILDEIDAFPFNDNEVLNAIFKRSVKGSYVLMSATPSKRIIEEIKKDNGEVISLFTRYHMYKIPVPVIHIEIGVFKYLYLIKKLKEYQKANKPCLVFAPTIRLCETVFHRIKMFVKGGFYVHSKCTNRGEIIRDFKKGKYRFLVTTAVLERGVTLANLQVIIFDACSHIYNKATLIQISGRVGRKISAPTGEVIFLATKTNPEMQAAIKEIQTANTHLPNML